MKEISVEEFSKLKDSSDEFYLLDVRETHEKEIADIGGVLIPLGQLTSNLPEVNKDQKIIVYCRSGGRSTQAAKYLSSLEFTDVYNLVGGILEYGVKIDTSIQQY